MRKTLAIAALLAAVPFAQAEDLIKTLDLTKATTQLSYNEETGAWTGTYDDDETLIESQCFEFVHSSISEWQTWWGFTASNSADRQRRTDYITYQYSNMPEGGIMLNEDGSIKKSENGTPVVSASVPYLVAYYSQFMAPRPIDMKFVDGKAYEAVGVYLTLNSYTYYTVEEGDAYCRSFADGDALTLTIHGVAPDQSEKTIDVKLASFENGDITITRGWKYVDLSELGTVNEIYFTMSSTDKGNYGDNTPEYFCMDKLMVRDTNSGINSVNASSGLAYDRETKLVEADGESFVAVYDVAGCMIAFGEGRVDVSGLRSGIYVARCGNESLKFAR